MLHSVAVYCSSSNQLRPSFYKDAFRLGELLAEAQMQLIYGDGGIGLMREVASGALSRGGEVVGVIPQFMVNEGWNNPESTRTIIVQTMHARKASIAYMADAMVALPGGIGTLEELSECITWKQLGLHVKPIVILNTDGFYDPLLRFFDHLVNERMMRDIHRSMFTVVSTPEEVIPALLNAPVWDKNIRREAAI